MKKLLKLSLFVFAIGIVPLIALAQNIPQTSPWKLSGTSILPKSTTYSVGVGVSSIGASAICQIDSTTKGFLLPRMTNTQRNNISTPATGLLVYNLTTLKLNQYDGSDWVEVGGSGGSMVYPGVGIALSTGSAWDTSIANNSANWNTAYGWNVPTNYVPYTGATSDVNLGVRNLTITGAGTIGGNTNTEQLIVKANASQTNANPLFQLQDSNGLELLSISTGINSSIYFGYQAGPVAVTSGANNFFMGTSVGASTTAGSSNVAIGNTAFLTNTTGGSNVAVGSQALQDADASNNVAVGDNALQNVTSGGANVGIGTGAGNFTKTGTNNTLIGWRAGYGASNQSYSNNLAAGYGAGKGLTTGSNNILLGYQAGDNLTSGANNIIIGYDLNAAVADSASTLNIGGLITGSLVATKSLNIDAVTTVKGLVVGSAPGDWITTNASSFGLYGFSPTADNTTGGSLEIAGGTGTGSGNGGSTDFLGGGADGTDGTGNGGMLSFQGGSGGATSGNGGDVDFMGGNALTDGAGGNIDFWVGLGANGGANGKFRFYNSGATIASILDFETVATADKTFTFPNHSLTFDNITTSSTTNGTGFVKGNGSVISFDNSTYLTAEADTFGTVTGRGKTSATQYASTEYTDTVAAGAVTVDWNSGNVHYMVLNAGANTITMTNPLAGGRYILNLKQAAAGAAGTVTFSPVPYWAGGTAPTLTATNNAVDVITFEYSAAIGKYIGSALIDVK